jgi:hypothetical protein
VDSGSNTNTKRCFNGRRCRERCCMIEMVDTVKHPYKDGGKFLVFLFILKKVHIVAFFLEAFIVIGFSSMS